MHIEKKNQVEADVPGERRTPANRHENVRQHVFVDVADRLEQRRPDALTDQVEEIHPVGQVPELTARDTCREQGGCDCAGGGARYALDAGMMPPSSSARIAPGYAAPFAPPPLKTSCSIGGYFIVIGVCPLGRCSSVSSRGPTA
ncbi:hypothetical protein [Burkholderia lata]|uniref:hypothetical protein n=1 Tax=Burkholderia lata (strain ATCC 17760 / DSM 23089 / LMG 22485 / NCIMB 9086 / R18194 / 383) TaxID=482957 RepID=UPI001582EC3E|nr:hypothetical protein [Burkholderia lata]